MAEKGGTWTFKLQVDLPLSGHDSSASSFNQVDEAFRTFLMPGKPDSLSNIEIFISCDGVTLCCRGCCFRGQGRGGYVQALVHEQGIAG